MILLSIPGYQNINLENLVLDFNGTLASDGRLSGKTRELVNEAAGSLKVYVLTADTFGSAGRECAGLKAELVMIDKDDGGPDKEAFIEKIGAAHTAAFGNGVNDVLMLAKAALGVVVMGPEGCAGQALARADVVVRDINEGLGLLLNPVRLAATLRK
ncbi:HAD family hydrolase [Phosphitispora fastidiosa]|uniref:HAD family hydrolase n=1 Tax=Phosphitispora fastidiosa TaxID=2837202 RepID=UPI001E2D11C5|nr:ATPase P [Phosphitispora fastidiosa]MBU7006745.1 soluble P-type ATPase [Phosphitispora fastidiosa]